MELIDIVDEKGNFTGQVMDKEEAHDKNLLHNEVAVFVINDKCQILLQKRNANKRFNANKWGLCAGHVDSGEKLEEAALRELKEEIGVDISINDLIPFSDREFTFRKINSRVNYFYYVKLNLNESDFVIQKEELSEVKWFDIDNVIEMIKEKDNSITLEEDRLHLIGKLKEL